MIDQARTLAAAGRYGDTELVHMSPEELDVLSQLGDLTINPETGLPEAFKFGKIFKGLGSILAGIAGGAFGGPLGAALGSGIFSGLTEKNLKKGLLAGLTAYAGGSVLDKLRGAGDVASKGLSSSVASTGGKMVPRATDLLPTGDIIGSGARSGAGSYLGDIGRGVRSLGGRGTLDTVARELGSPGKMAFLYPQMSNLAQSIEQDRTQGNYVDPYDQELQDAWRAYRRRFGNNPYANMYSYRTGYRYGGMIPGYADGGYIPLADAYSEGYDGGSDSYDEGSGKGTGSRSGGGGFKDWEDKIRKLIDDERERLEGPSGNAPDMKMPIWEPRKIAEGFNPGYMPEYRYFGDLNTHPSNMGYDTGPMVGANPFTLDLMEGLEGMSPAGFTSYESPPFQQDNFLGGIASVYQSPQGLAGGGIVDGDVMGYHGGGMVGGMNPMMMMGGYGGMGGYGMNPMMMGGYGMNPMMMGGIGGFGGYGMMGGYGMNPMMSNNGRQTVNQSPLGVQQPSQDAFGGSSANGARMDMMGMFNDPIRQARMGHASAEGKIRAEERRMMEQFKRQQGGVSAPTPASASPAQAPLSTAIPLTGLAGGGMVGGGMSDSVIMPVRGQQDPVAVSPGEYVVPADVVSMLGDGDSGSGARALEQMVGRIRTEKTGSPNQAPPIHPTVLPA